MTSFNRKVMAQSRSVLITLNSINFKTVQYKIAQIHTFKITTCKISYDFSTIYGDIYKTVYHCSKDFGPVSENGHFDTT